MIVHGDLIRLGDKVVFAARCSHCSSPVGDLSGEEVSALLSGKWGPVLCFACEEITCPVCGFTMVDERGIKDLKEFGKCFFCRAEAGAIKLLGVSK